jgi:hypothetical protein
MNGAALTDLEIVSQMLESKNFSYREYRVVMSIFLKCPGKKTQTEKENMPKKLNIFLILNLIVKKIEVGESQVKAEFLL